MAPIPEHRNRTFSSIQRSCALSATIANIVSRYKAWIASHFIHMKQPTQEQSWCMQEGRNLYSSFKNQLQSGLLLLTTRKFNQYGIAFKLFFTTHYPIILLTLATSFMCLQNLSTVKKWLLILAMFYSFRVQILGILIFFTLIKSVFLKSILMKLL